MMKPGLKWMQWAAWLAALALAACGGSAPPAKVTADWLTNPDEAFQTAAQKGRPVFIAFVGSDWSGASQGITKDVFDTQTFKDFADNYLVLLRVDLARHPASATVAQLSETLAEGVQVDGLPTTILFDPMNKIRIGKFNGYESGGPTPYLQHLVQSLQQWQQSLAQSRAAGTPGQSGGVPQLSAPPSASPAGAPGVSGIPVTTPQDLVMQQALQAAPMPSSLSVAPPAAPPSAPMPTPEQLMQQSPPPAPAPAPAASSATDLPLLNTNSLK
jgi:hypothetical protein